MGGAAAGISFDEQIEIMGEINDVLDRNKIEIRPDTFQFVPRKRGGVVPVLVNVLVAAAAALGILVFLRVFNEREQSLTGRAATVLTAEGKIVEAVRAESEAQLSAKDQEISRIQARLEALRQERERLKLEMDVRIRERENELRAQLSRQLEEERQRLRQAGMSAAGIQEQLSELEGRLAAERERELARFRGQAEGELAEKDAEIARLIDQNNSLLTQLRTERTELQAQLQRREQELRSQGQQQVAAVESERSRIAGELEQLQGERARERAVLDQIMAQYLEIRGHVAAGRHAAALRALDGLERYLGSVSALPAVQRRLPVESFTIASLRELVRLQEAAAGQVQTASQADLLLASIRSTVQEADRRRFAGDSAGALELYAQAVATLPEIEHSHRALLDSASAGSLGQIQQEMRQSEDALRRLQNQLRQAQTRMAQQSREITRLEAEAEARQALLRRLQELQGRYGALDISGVQSAAASQERVLQLLEVKLKVRQALASEPTRSQNPGLYQALEQYLAALAEEQQQRGREAALEDAIGVLDSLPRRGGRVDLEALKARYAGAGQAELFARFLDELEAVLKQP